MSIDTTYDDALKQDAPLLFGLERTALETPKGYFESLPDKVMQRVEDESSRVLIVNHRPSKRIAWSIAAGLALLLGSYFLMLENVLNNEGPNVGEMYAVDIDQDMDYLLEIDENILFDFIAMNTTENDDAEIEFLLDENVELDEIINQEL